MGGLVARTLLEGSKYKAQKWFKRITRMVSVCVPQVGAPLAVGRALGLEGSMSIQPPDMDRCGLRPADDVEGYGLMCVAAQTADLEIAKAGVERITQGG